MKNFTALILILLSQLSISQNDFVVLKNNTKYGGYIYEVNDSTVQMKAIAKILNNNVTKVDSLDMNFYIKNLKSYTKNGKYYDSHDILSKIERNKPKNDFEYNIYGLTPQYLVLKKDSFSSSELYNSSINWIKTTYKNPKAVIKTSIQDKYIRIEGYEKNVIVTKTLGSYSYLGAKYIIELQFKDGKIRFEPISLKYNVNSIETSLDLKSGKLLYNEEEELKKVYDKQPQRVQDLFNRLKKSLNESVTKKDFFIDDDW